MASSGKPLKPANNLGLIDLLMCLQASEAFEPCDVSFYETNLVKARQSPILKYSSINELTEHSVLSVAIKLEETEAEANTNLRNADPIGILLNISRQP